jgi:broad specificity phosphatase PhoE
MSASTTSQSNAQGSPVTGIIDEKQVFIDFGKYEGRTVSEIAELDREFYNKLASEKDNGIFAIRRHKDKTFRLYVNPLTQMDH